MFLRYLLILACQLLFLLRYSLLCLATYMGKAKGQTAICLRPDIRKKEGVGKKGGVSIKVSALRARKPSQLVSSWVGTQGKKRSDCLRFMNSRMILKIPNQHLCCQDFTPNDTYIGIDSDPTDGPDGRQITTVVTAECPGLGPSSLQSTIQKSPQSFQEFLTVSCLLTSGYFLMFLSSSMRLILGFELGVLNSSVFDLT